MKSSKYCINHILILLALLVLISSSVSALTEDFSAFAAKQDINVCACDLKTETITIENTGDITSSFSISTDGDAAKWVNLAPETFILEPGELKQVEQFIKIPCKIQGEFTLNTTIKTMFDVKKSLQQTIKTSNCQNIQIIPKFSGVQNECPCTPVQYAFEVVNTGNHLEMYEISVEPYSEAITLSTNFLILEPGEKHGVDVFINLPCGEYGEKLFTFNVLAQGTGILGQIDFVLDIDKCYNYDLIVGGEYGLCQGIPNIIPIQIQNNADISNEFILTVDGADWAYAENISVAAWGGEIVDSNIILIPPIGEENIYSINLNVLSIRGEEGKIAEILLDTDMCYDYELIETEDVFNAVECREKEHTFILKNIGSRETTYLIDLEGFDWLTTTFEPIILQPGEEVELVVVGNTPCDISGQFVENIYVTITEINQTYLEEKVFTIHTKEEAFLPEIEFNDLKISFDGGETEIKIKNTGFEIVNYNLNLIASDWITLDRTTINLVPGENTTLLLQAYPTDDVWADIYAGELIVRVVDEAVEYSLDFFVEVGQEEDTPLWIIVAVGGGVLLLLALIVLIIILISSKKRKKTNKEEVVEDKKPEKKTPLIDKRKYSKKKAEDKKTKLWPVLLVIGLILLLCGATYYAYSSGLMNVDVDNNLVNDTLADLPVEETTEEVVAHTEPEQTETAIITNDNIQESLITIDRSSMPGDGNVFELTNETEINLDMNIKNPTDRKANLVINTPENSWVEFSQKKVTVLPESTKTINIKIIPDLTALDTNDYSVLIGAVLEGKKIQYEETLDLVIKKNKNDYLNILAFWPWVLGGLVLLGSTILIIILASREKKPNEKPVKEKKIKKEKKKTNTNIQKDNKKIWPWIIGSVVALLIIITVGIYAYNTFMPSENIVEDVDLGLDEKTETIEENSDYEKLTEDDIEESLITLDRSGVPGDDNVLDLENIKYTMPLSINNPTDNKARFAVSTNNNSWIVFEEYKIIVEPETTNVVNMTINPDMEALKESDYLITINTKLEGIKIDYEEELSFVVREKKEFEISIWLFALIGLVLLGIVIFILEFIKNSKPSGINKKNKKTKKKIKKDKDITRINKDISALRKKTVLKVKKAAY